MANGEVGLTDNAKRVLCLVTFHYGSWVSLGSKPSCLWFQPDCWGFQGEIEDLRRSFKYILLSIKLQLDYWTKFGTRSLFWYFKTKKTQRKLQNPTVGTTLNAFVTVDNVHRVLGLAASYFVNLHPSLHDSMANGEDLLVGLVRVLVSFGGVLSG